MPVLSARELTASCELLHFDFDVDAGRKVQICQGVDGLGCGVIDVDQALVHPHFKLLTGVLVHERRTIDSQLRFLCWERHWALHGRTIAQRCFDDRARRLINDLMVVRANLNSNTLS